MEAEGFAIGATHQPVDFMEPVGDPNGYDTAQEAVAAAQQYVAGTSTYEGAVVVSLDGRFEAMHVDTPLFFQNSDGSIRGAEGIQTAPGVSMSAAIDGSGNLVPVNSND
jgi:hypothetical protein